MNRLALSVVLMLCVVLAAPYLDAEPVAVPSPLPLAAPAAGTVLEDCPVGPDACTGSMVRYGRHELFDCGKAVHPPSPGRPQPLVSAADQCRARVRQPKPCRCVAPAPSPITAPP